MLEEEEVGCLGHNTHKTVAFVHVQLPLAAVLRLLDVEEFLASTGSIRPASSKTALLLNARALLRLRIAKAPFREISSDKPCSTLGSFEAVAACTVKAPS